MKGSLSAHELVETSLHIGLQPHPFLIRSLSSRSASRTTSLAVWYRPLSTFSLISFSSSGVSDTFMEVFVLDTTVGRIAVYVNI